MPDRWNTIPLTEAEDIAGTVGSLLGLVSPINIGTALGGKVTSKLPEWLNKASQAGQATSFAKNALTAERIKNITDFVGANNEIVKKAIAGAFVGGTQDFFEEGISPMDALIGAAIGYKLGGGKLTRLYPKKTLEKVLKSVKNSPIAKATPRPTPSGYQ